MFSQLSNAPSNVALRLLDQELYCISLQYDILPENDKNEPFWPIFALYTVNMPILSMVLESLTDFSGQHMPAGFFISSIVFAL